MNHDLYKKQRTDSFLKSGDVGIIVMWVNYTHELERELTAATAECLEQARLLGMSGEREAALLSELDAIKRGHGELGKYEQLRLKNAELHSIIDRASAQFFHQGTDGEIATNMIVILREAK